MNIKYWSGFSKRKNSTKQPTGGTDCAVVLKEDTSILQPTFIVSTIPDTVNYVQAFGRYYFVTDITRNINGSYELQCTVDELASYKSNIASYSGFIEYATSSNDVTITDPRNEPTGILNTTYDTISFNNSPFSKSGCYIIAVLNEGGGGTGIGTYYALDDNEFLTFKGEVYDSTFIGQIIDQFTQVRDSFVSCIWVPIDKSYISGVNNTAIKIGRVTLPAATGKMITNRKISFNTGAATLNFPSGAGAGVQLQYIDRPPYTTGYILLPFIGMVPLDMDIAAMYKNLQINAYIDVITGDLVYRLSYGGGAASSYNGNIATKTPISASSYDAVGVASGVLTTIGGVVGAIATAGSGGAAAIAAGSAIAGGLATTKKSLELHSMINGSTSSAIGAELGLIPAWVIHQYIPSMTNLTSIQQEQGMPYFNVNTVSNLSGYIKFKNASITISGYDAERDAINSYLNSGFYYE